MLQSCFEGSKINLTFSGHKVYRCYHRWKNHVQQLDENISHCKKAYAIRRHSYFLTLTNRIWTKMCIFKSYTHGKITSSLLQNISSNLYFLFIRLSLFSTLFQTEACEWGFERLKWVSLPSRSWSSWSKHSTIQFWGNMCCSSKVMLSSF